MRIILFLVFILTFSMADDEKFMISKIENLQNSYFKNQIVHLKLNTIIAKGNDINISVPNAIIKTTTDDNSTFHTDLYFHLKDRFPMITISILDNNQSIGEENLTINSSINNLTPPLNFSNVIADKFNISNISSSLYDDSNNLVSLNIEANQSNLEDFSINAFKDGEVKYSGNMLSSKISYYLIVPNSIKEVEFSYFNLEQNRYITKYIKIHPKIERISTQTDINPKDHNYLLLINVLMLVIVLLWLILFYVKRKKIYLILIFISVLALVFFNWPKKKVELMEGAKIHILPTPQSTVFFVLGINTKLEVLNSREGYDKVMINNQVGWVKDKYVNEN